MMKQSHAINRRDGTFRAAYRVRSPASGQEVRLRQGSKLIRVRQHQLRFQIAVGPKMQIDAGPWPGANVIRPPTVSYEVIGRK
jgi:hypothetical protein